MNRIQRFHPQGCHAPGVFLGCVMAAVMVTAPSPAAGATQAGNPRDGSRLILRAGAFDPASQPAASGLRSRPPAWGLMKAQDQLHMIQFSSAPEAAWLEDLEAQGAVFFDYLPENAYVARLPEHRLHAIIATQPVRAVVPYLPGYRVDPGLMEAASAGGEEDLTLLLKFAPDLDAGEARAAINQIARQLIPSPASRHPGGLLVTVPIAGEDLASLLPRLASLPELLWIERRVPAELMNGDMLGVLQTGEQGKNRLFDMGLTGTGEIVAQADSGVDVDHCFFTDPLETVSLELIDTDAPPATPASNPSHRKVLAYQYHVDTDTVDDQGHGTHVAGTAVGDDLAHPAGGSDPGLDLHDGMAPAARLVVQDLDGPGGADVDLPTNLYGFVQAAYNLGARIHTNSWGSPSNVYSEDSSSFDRFTWDHPDMLFLIAAGNYGPDSASVANPATAKNVVSVGMAQSPGIGGRENNLAPASSKGPTSDGRRKPELTNVGGGPITSAAAGTACDLTDMGGTSMATPGVAGAAALVRQYLAQGFYPHGYPGSGPSLLPSAALLKSILINSAVNMSGNNVDADIPDNSQGWGRVLLDNALFFPSDDRRLLILQDDDLASAMDGFPVVTPATASFSLYQCRPDIPLKITLAWSEPPVASTSGQAWVNDLDLEVEAPDGTTIYLGNVFSGGVSTVGGAPDDRNNVEQVLIPAGEVQTGTYTVRVVPSTIAVGPQPYALLATGDVSLAPEPRVALSGPVASGGNDGDPYLDQNETLTLTYGLENTGCGDAAGLQATLAADTGLAVSISPTTLSLGGLPAGDTVSAVFQVSLGSAPGVCGDLLSVDLTVEDAPTRWVRTDDLTLELDPGSGTRTHLEDMEGGDTSISHSSEWNLAGCRTTSGATSWHMGESDCSGIPRDSSGHILRFEVAVAVGEQLDTVSFMHAFDGYSDGSSFDKIHFEIDHDGDGNWDSIASWNDGEAPASMSTAGPFDISAYNGSELSSAPQFRFRFKSAANWVGGPNNASGWDVDDLSVNLNITGMCETCSLPLSGPVGDTLLVGIDGATANLSWDSVPDASAYRILRAPTAGLASPATYETALTTFSDPDLPGADSILFYRVLGLNACGSASLE